MLLDDEFSDTTHELLGDIDVPQSDIADLAREIMTPEHLQKEVEEAVHGTIAYLNKETDEPDVFIDFGPPLDNAKPALLGYVDRRIDALDERRVDTFDELQEQLEELYRTVERGEIPTSMPRIEDPGILVATYVEDTLASLQPVQVSNTREFEQELENIYNDLTAGRLPTTIPSIEGIPPEQIEEFILAYDQVVAALKANPDIPLEVRTQAISGLRENEEAIKTQIRERDVRGALTVATEPLTAPVTEAFVDDAYDSAFQKLQESGFPQRALDGLEARADEVKGHLGAVRLKDSLKVGARGLAEPLIDAALDELREELDDQERLDLVAIAAEQNNQNKAQFLEDDIDLLRDVIERTDVGVWLTLLVIVGSALLMVVIHIPHINSALRWPGLTLFLSGLVSPIIGLVLNSVVSGRFDDFLDRGVSAVSPIPPSMIDVINDVLTSMASDAFGAFILPSVILMVVGFVLLLGSIIVRWLHIPILSR